MIFISRKLKKLVSVLRFTPFDNSSEQGSSNERYRRIGLTAIASILARIISVITTLVSVPLTIHYLGVERYGMWMTISSLVAFLGFADLGLGNGLINAIANAHGRNDHQSAKRFVSSAFFMLLGIAFMVALSAGFIYPWLNWKFIFNISSPTAVSEAGPAMVVYTVCSLINIPLAIVQRVHIGYQEGFINNLWNILGNILGLLGILLAIYFKSGLPWLVFAMIGAPILSTLINSWSLFVRKRPWLRPSLQYVELNALKKLFQIGAYFFILQIIYLIVFSSDNIIIAQILGPSSVTDLVVPQKLFSFLPMLMGLIFVPLWPAYGEAIARGDRFWVSTALRRSILGATFGSVAFSTLLFLFGTSIIKIWVGEHIKPSYLLLSGIGIQTIVSTVAMPLSVFLNGANIMRFQVILGIIVAIVSLTMKIILTNVIGLAAIPWSTGISQAVFWVIPVLYALPRLFNNIHPNNLSVTSGLSRE